MADQTAQEMIASLLSKRYSLTNIQSKLKDSGHLTSISNLSRVNSGERKASAGLTSSLSAVIQGLKND